MFFSACEGPEGPPGPQGAQGEQGESGESGYIFEYENIDFTSSNDYTVYLEYPDDFVSLDTDVALVYLFWGTEDAGGESVDVWRALPQMVLTENGWLQYNYDFAVTDVKVFLDADFDMANLEAIDTDDWYARVVIVPGDYWDTGARKSIPDYDTLIEELNLTDSPVKVSYSTPRRSVDD